MNTSRLVIGIGVLLLASPVFAQGAPPPPPPPPMPGGSGPSGTGLAGWSTSVSDNPFTLNGGMLEIHGSLPIFGIGTTTVNPMGMTTTSTQTIVLLGGGASYGINDQIEIGGDYAFLLSPKADFGGVLAGHALYRLFHNDTMSAAIGVAAAFSPNANDLLLAGGIAFRYRITKMISLYTTTGGLPFGCGECLHVAGPVIGQGVVDIGTGTGGTTSVLFSLPVGLGIQATPELYIYGSTDLFTLGSGNGSTASTVIFRDYVTANVGAWYSVSNKLRLGLNVFDDLEHAGDFFLVEFMAKIYVGG